MDNRKRLEIELGISKIVPILLRDDEGEARYGFFDRADFTSQASRLSRIEMILWMTERIRTTENSDVFQPGIEDRQASDILAGILVALDEEPQEPEDRDKPFDFIREVARWYRGGWVASDFKDKPNSLTIEPFDFTDDEIDFIFQLIDNEREVEMPEMEIEFGEVKVNLARKYSRVTEQADGVSSYFDLSLCNIQPSAETIVDRVKAIKSKPKSEQPKNIAMLFHGLPGTGKSELARYIAHELGLPLMKKTFGEVQSKYIGEGEKNLRKVFIEAAQRGAVLLFDEIDSFTSNRESSEKEWTRNMTNQFLNELDEYSGIFIGTSNFISHMDAAVLRRLHLKVEFLELDFKQKKKAFKTYFPELRTPKKLAELKFLTPGDFNAVKTKALYEPKVPTANRVIEMLREELQTKFKASPSLKRKIKDSNRVPLGFTTS